MYKISREPTQIEFSTALALPYIAHDASTVTVLMHVKKEDWNILQPSTRDIPFSIFVGSGGHCCAVDYHRF